MKRSSLQKNKAASKQGFTILETLVAAIILGTAVAAPLSVANKGLMTAGEARDQLTASYLAQEAVEHIRNMRDRNALRNSRPWLRGIDDCLEGNECGVDVTRDYDSSIIRCSGANGFCTLQYDTARNIYGHGSGGTWQQTKFKRQVSITETDEDAEAKVHVVVEWTTRSVGTRRFTIEGYLFNWQNQ